MLRLQKCIICAGLTSLLDKYMPGRTFTKPCSSLESAMIVATVARGGTMPQTKKLAALLLACSLLGASPAPGRVILVSKDIYKEQYPNRALIGSVAAIVGWHGGAIARRLDRPELSIAGIQQKDRTLCITVEHVSGGYIGAARLKVDGRTDRLTLRLPATIFERRPDMQAADLSVLVQASSLSRCSPRSPVLTVAWGTPENDVSTLYLNAGRGTSTRLSITGLAKPVRCTRLDDVLPNNRAIRQRFNTVCQTTLPRVCRADTPFEIVTDAGDGAAPPATGTLRRSCGA